MSEHRIVESNVLAKKIEFNNGIAWKVGDIEHRYGWALVMTAEGKMADVLNAPIGFEITGDVLEVKRVRFYGNRKETYTEIVFQPHNGIVTDKQSLAWDKEKWIKNFGNDDHFYKDVDSVTYKDPKTGKVRTDKVFTISIQKEVNVIVHKKNGNRPTTAIPIKNVIERHLIK